MTTWHYTPYRLAVEGKDAFSRTTAPPNIKELRAQRSAARALPTSLRRILLESGFDSCPQVERGLTALALVRDQRDEESLANRHGEETNGELS